MRTTTASTPGTQKVRRESLGSKRAPGWEWQQAGRRVRRASADALRVGKVDPSLSGVGGLVSFNRFVQAEGVPVTFRDLPKGIDELGEDDLVALATMLLSEAAYHSDPRE